MNQLDEVIHQPVRLKIMAALKALPHGKGLEFVRLRSIVGATETFARRNPVGMPRRP